ncbi:MAG TPA: DNA-binding domain-containing protein [Gammaproteobacteria bacterium]|jgi:hypothetical protein|nr:DNA-binding domain-containing protein [Gammaproteobacteria bacterium]
MTPNLQQLQNQFQNYLLTQDATIQPAIVSTQVSAATRLEIYRQAYYLRLLEALMQDYTGLQQCMGSAAFEQLGCDFIDAYPSHYRSIRWFGKELVDFMQSTPAYQAQPWLIEMARFEWLLTEAFDAADQSIVTLEQMAAVPFEQWPLLSFQLHPAVRRLELTWNIVPIWNSYQEETATPELVGTANRVPWLIWRHEDVLFRSLAADEAYLLDALLSGENFGMICQGLCVWLPEEQVALYAAQELKRLILDQVISGITIKTP